MFLLVPSSTATGQTLKLVCDRPVNTKKMTEKKMKKWRMMKMKRFHPLHHVSVGCRVEPSASSLNVSVSSMKQSLWFYFSSSSLTFVSEVEQPGQQNPQPGEGPAESPNGSDVSAEQLQQQVVGELTHFVKRPRREEKVKV